MPNILPRQPEPVSPPVQEAIPQEVLDAGITVKNLEILDYLGLKNSMFDQDVMEKVAYLSDKLDSNTIRQIDLKLGNDPSIPKLDKLYAYVRLIDEENRLAKEQELIRNQKRLWQAHGQRP
jgi:hypothetical protein